MLPVPANGPRAAAATGLSRPGFPAADEPAPSSPAKPLLVINASHRPRARHPGIYGRQTSTLNKLVVFTTTHHVKAQTKKKKKILVPSLISNKAVAGNPTSRQPGKVRAPDFPGKMPNLEDKTSRWGPANWPAATCTAAPRSADGQRPTEPGRTAGRRSPEVPRFLMLVLDPQPTISRPSKARGRALVGPLRAGRRLSSPRPAGVGNFSGFRL